MTSYQGTAPSIGAIDRDSGRARTVRAIPLAAVALAASLTGGILGGAVGSAVPALVGAQAERDAVAKALEQAKWLDYGRAWEARYRVIYPNSR